MAEAKRAWDEVGKGFVDLGATLRSHFGERTGEGADADTAPADAESAAEAERTGAGVTEQLQAALQQLAVAVEGAFEAVGRAVKDPEVTTEVRNVGQSLATALTTSFTEVGDEVKRAFRRGQEQASDDATPPASPASPASPSEASPDAPPMDTTPGP
jgi:hypothetical protein